MERLRSAGGHRSCRFFISEIAPCLSSLTGHGNGDRMVPCWPLYKNRAGQFSQTVDFLGADRKIDVLHTFVVNRKTIGRFGQPALSLFLQGEFWARGERTTFRWSCPPGGGVNEPPSNPVGGCSAAIGRTILRRGTGRSDPNKRRRRSRSGPLVPAQPTSVVLNVATRRASSPPASFRQHQVPVSLNCRPDLLGTGPRFTFVRGRAPGA